MEHDEPLPDEPLADDDAEHLPEEAPNPGKRQTLTYLRGLFEERGLKPKSKLGQNFLIDLNFLDYIVRQADLRPDDLVLEVGTGTGTLTGHLVRHAGSVLSIDLDADFQALAEETLGHPPHLELIHADVLENKNRLNPFLLERLQALKEKFSPARLKLVANLPYAVATPVISNLLQTDFDFERMVVLVQWEIGLRLVARPGTKHYGALAILVQSLANVEILRRLPPAIFWPRPKVASALVRIFPSRRRKDKIPDLPAFRNFLRDLYSHRRKNLRGGLRGIPGRRSKEEIDALLAELGLDGSVRAETLDRRTHLRLCEAFRRGE